MSSKSNWANMELIDDDESDKEILELVHKNNVNCVQICPNENLTENIVVEKKKRGRQKKQLDISNNNIELIGKEKPCKPLEKAKLTLIRHSSSEPDYDGLVSSFKYVIDSLVTLKILVNDKSKNIGVPDYKWQKAPAMKGFITVGIEEA